MKEKRTRQGQEEIPSYVLGVEITPETLAVALIDEDGRPVAGGLQETPQRTTRAAVAALTDMLLALASSKERGARRISALGISVAGYVDPATQRVTIPALQDEKGWKAWKGWTRVNLPEMIEECLIQSGYDISTPAGVKRARADRKEPRHLPMRVSPRVACLAAAESWVGRGRGKEHLVYLSLGNTIEAGIISGGQALQGADGLAGSVGWLSLAEAVKAEYKIVGCLAAEVGPESFPRRALEEWSEGATSMLGKLIKAEGGRIDAEKIVRAARGGDDLALRIVHQTCGWVGRAVANLLAVLNPEAIILGGELGTLLKPYLNEIHTEAEQWTTPELLRSCRLTTSVLGPEAGVIGAAFLAESKLKAG